MPKNAGKEVKFMSDANNSRLSKKVLQRDIEVFDVLKAIVGYVPSKPELSIASLTTQKQAKETAQETETQSLATLKANRDNAVAGEKGFHANLLAAIDQVRAFFGENSNEYQGLGRKKKSEHKSPKRKKKDDTKP